MSASPSQHPRSKLREALLVFLAVTLISSVLYRVTALAPYFHALVAALFLYVPAVVLWRRGHELDAYGLRTRPLGLGLVLVALGSLALLPPFGAGFILWQRIACAHPALTTLAAAPCHAALHLRLRLPGALAERALAELLVVALPEEFFFRGYLQGRFTEHWPTRHRVLGAPVGLALLLSSLLFALCHIAVQGNPAPIVVFFPSLVFGWMRAKTGSILAGTMFHALCNLYIEMLQTSLMS